jgi:hypothetical protein
MATISNTFFAFIILYLLAPLLLRFRPSPGEQIGSETLDREKRDQSCIKE